MTNGNDFSKEPKMERDILLLGDPRLYEIAEEVKKEELESLKPVFTDMFDCIKAIRRDYGFGRAIAAPQIGVRKRLICILTDRPYVIINPALEFLGDDTMELMDDCMSFPDLLVRVRRYRHCILRYRDENWMEQTKRMDDDMAELIQHEYDHLDGILATMRAIDNKSFVMRK
jgi:peptide deformylase